MSENTQREAAGRGGFWGCGSVAGLFLLALFLFVQVGTWPRSIRHPGVQSIVGYSSYRGARTFNVAIRPPRSANDTDPMVAIIEGPSGTKRSAGIRLDCDVYWATDFLTLVFSHNVRGFNASIHHKDIQLSDSEGHRFTVLPPVEGDYGLVFPIPDKEAIEHIRFNDTSYYLSLKASFDLAGPRVIDAPRLDPVVNTKTLVGDTPGYAIAMLSVFACLYLAPLISLVLIARAARRWRRGRATAGKGGDLTKA